MCASARRCSARVRDHCGGTKPYCSTARSSFRHPFVIGWCGAPGLTHDRSNQGVFAMIRRRIFLVDDDAELRKSLMDQLMHYREFELIEAGTAAEALRKVREAHVDLMILD